MPSLKTAIIKQMTQRRPLPPQTQRMTTILQKAPNRRPRHYSMRSNAFCGNLPCGNICYFKEKGLKYISQKGLSS